MLIKHVTSSINYNHIWKHFWLLSCHRIMRSLDMPFMTETCRKETLNKIILREKAIHPMVGHFFQQSVTKTRNFSSPPISRGNATERGFVYFGVEILRKVWCVQIWWIYHSGISFDLSFNPTFKMTLMLPYATNPSKHHLGQYLITPKTHHNLMMRSHSSWECKFLLKWMVEICVLIYPCSSSIIFDWFVHVINHLPPPLPTSIFYAKPRRKKNTTRNQNRKHQRWGGISMCFWQNAVGSAHRLLAGLHKFHGQLFSRLAWLRLDVCLWKQAAGR